MDREPPAACSKAPYPPCRGSDLFLGSQRRSNGSSYMSCLQPRPEGIVIVCIHIAQQLYAASASVASSILPACPPPLFPFVAIKHRLSELDIDSIVRLTHPPAKLVSVAHFRRIPTAHPRPEVISTHPARVQFSEQCHELFRFRLLGHCRVLWVRRGHGVQEVPR